MRAAATMSRECSMLAVLVGRQSQRCGRSASVLQESMCAELLLLVDLECYGAPLVLARLSSGTAPFSAHLEGSRSATPL